MAQVSEVDEPEVLTEEQEREALLRERQELYRELEELKQKATISLQPSKVLMATVPDYMVRVEFHYPAVKDPSDKSGIALLSRPVHVDMNDGDILYKYPDKDGVEGQVIPPDFIDGIAERYGKYGIVIWEHLRKPEEGGETKEQAKRRGIQAFIDYALDMEANMLTRNSEIAAAKGYNSVPPEHLWRRKYPQEHKIKELRLNAEKALKKLKA